MSKIKIEVGGKYKAICVDVGPWGSDTTEFEYEVVKFENNSGVDGCNYLIKSGNSDYDGYYLDESGEWFDGPELYVKTLCAIKEPVENLAPATEDKKEKSNLSLEVGKSYIDSTEYKVEIFGEANGVFAGVSDDGCYNFYDSEGYLLDENANIDFGILAAHLVKLAQEKIKIDLWVNVYKQGWGAAYYTKEYADTNKNEMKNFVEQVHFLKEVEVS